VLSTASGKLSGVLGRARVATQKLLRSGGVAIGQTLAASSAVVVIAAGALIFDAMTPQMIAVGLFYVAIVLTGFWFPKPKAALALALVATPLVIIGYWLAIPQNVPAWEAWTNRALAIGTVWLTAIFVWHIRVLEQKLEVQIGIANSLSHEMSHRVGNSLQLVASFLRLQAQSTNSEGSRHILETAGSRVMVIGRIQRMLSHFGSPRTVDSKHFIIALTHDVRSTFPDPDKIGINVEVDAAELTSTTATVLGAILVELINNALKHAFREGMEGTLAVRFIASKNTDRYVVEVEDDGVGIDQAQMPDGFGTQNITDLSRLIAGSVTCQAARTSNARPGTMWRLDFPQGRLH
jgi:two-component sensor histidine kinase